ncbi:MAG: hypothetical protein ACRD9L_11000 [Bryobacteraceae bacterium]
MPGTHNDADVFSAAVQAVSPLLDRIGDLFQKSGPPGRRRSAMERRKEPDRRVSPIVQRLRTGLWLQFHQATRAGEFSSLDLDASRLANLVAQLLPEGRKYTYTDRDTQDELPANAALQCALRFALAHRAELITSRGGDPQAVLVICMIAEYLCRNYEMTIKDRRIRERRVTGA